ncbi:bacteriohemerythrin [Desulfovibrio gilichinskyi]|uniref:Hemerythrin n=1 Tax=Desulfovibrio gilichinskyi TaxID=1519643 RepID=A0A1X7F011_9BACT|nr:bacteriohemerythrin [Desulfovibrio gilichinskyi]SMF43096.1 hemerythrin [Desulfovibrio gilichinskyi]
MPLLTWNSNYSVGIKIIDDDHKVLIDMINKACDSIERMEEQKVLIGLVSDMRQYGMQHFSTEEGLMKEHDYPDIESHKKLHNHFIIYAASLDNMHDSDKENLEPLKIFKYLADWLRNHILIIDKKFGSFLIDKGVK